MPAFSNAAWDKSRTNKLSAADYCRVCMFDLNPSGQPKVKAKCKGPIRYTPGGPIVKAALRSLSGRIFQVQGAPAAKKKSVARRLVSLMRQAKIEISSKALLQLAGGRN